MLLIAILTNGKHQPLCEPSTMDELDELATGYTKGRQDIASLECWTRTGRGGDYEINGLYTHIANELLVRVRAAAAVPA